MSTLDDFFGSSDEAVEECSFCGRSENGSELIVSVQDHNGPTHWHHEACKAKDDVSKGTPLIPTWDETIDSA